MRYYQITEAPLGDFAIYGDKENEGSFAAADVKAFNNPKWLKKVESHFSRTPYTFNIFLYNAPGGVIYPDTNAQGEPDMNRPTRNIQRIFRGPLTLKDRQHLDRVLNVEFPRSREAINIILTDNEGDEKVGLTPWILAHRVAHAVLQDYASGYSLESEHSFALRQLISAGDGLLQMARNVGKPADIFRFKSAKQGNIVRDGEYIVEMFTQYIVQGSITLNYPDVPKYEVPLMGSDPAFTAMKEVFEQDIKTTISGGEALNRAEIWEGIAARAGITVEQAQGVIPKEVFYDVFWEVQSYISKMLTISDLKRRVVSFNTRVGEFLEECVGRTFILGAPRRER